MQDKNSILNAKTIPDFLQAVNREYSLNLPTDFSGDSPVSQLMGAETEEITEKEEKYILYTARGQPINFKTTQSKALKAGVIIKVKTSTAV